LVLAIPETAADAAGHAAEAAPLGIGRWEELPSDMGYPVIIHFDVGFSGIFSWIFNRFSGIFHDDFDLMLDFPC
jgi:hypothetical protein